MKTREKMNSRLYEKPDRKLTSTMKGSVSSLKQQLLEDLLGERLEEYKNFSREKPTTKKRNHRQLIPLWKFMLQLLHRDTSSKYVEWTEEDPLQFRIKEPSFVADLWGSMKYKSGMNYEKLSRAMRYYYGKDIIEKVGHKRYCYQFIISKKTKKYISQFMDVDGSTLKRKQRRLTSSIRSADVTDDDSSSTSSTTSCTSDDALPLPNNSLQAAKEAVIDKDDEEFDKHEQKGNEKGPFNSVTSNQVTFINIQTVRKPQTKHDDRHKIVKSALNLIENSSQRPSAFSRATKGRLNANEITNSSKPVSEQIYISKRPILPYKLFKQQLLTGCNTSIYTLTNSKMNNMEPVPESKADVVDTTRQTCSTKCKGITVGMLSCETKQQFNISAVQDRTKKRKSVHNEQRVAVDLEKCFPNSHLAREIIDETTRNLSESSQFCLHESDYRKHETYETVVEDNSMVRQKDPFMGFADARTDFSFSQPYLSEIFNDA